MKMSKSFYDPELPSFKSQLYQPSVTFVSHLTSYYGIITVLLHRAHWKDLAHSKSHIKVVTIIIIASNFPLLCLGPLEFSLRVTIYLSSKLGQF